MLTVTPHSFITTQALQARLKRNVSAEDDVEQRLTDAVNGAAHWMEMVTRRKLKARNHRTANTIVCSAAADSLTITGSGFGTTLQAGDDMAGVGVAVGSQVDSIDSAASLTATRKTTADIAAGSITFGSRPLRASGDGTNELYLAERPIVEVFSAFYDVAGTLTAIDLANAVYDHSVGRILLATGAFPKGSLNILINARVGYAEPTETDLGHEEWHALEALALRVGEVFYTDGIHIRGRTESVSVGNLSTQTLSTPMPADVISAITPFIRRW